MLGPVMIILMLAAAGGVLSLGGSVHTIAGWRTRREDGAILPENGDSVKSSASDSVDALYEHWMEFLEVRVNQSDAFNAQFPVDERLYGNVRACGRALTPLERYHFESADTLAPAMIEIYAEIGYLTTFCASESPPRYASFDKKKKMFYTRVHDVDSLSESAPFSFDLHKFAATFATRCTSSLQSASRRPSLARIFRAAGADRLEVFEVSSAHDSLQAWTRSIIQLITRAENYAHRWKFLLLAPGLFDIPRGGASTQMVDDVTQSLELIHHWLPTRTYVVVLRDAGLHFWRTVAQNFVFCDKMHALWRINTTANAEKWQTLEAHIESTYHTYEDFYVETIDMLEGASPVYSRDYGLDISVLSADCAHLSSRGVALLHTHLWNRLVQPTRHHRHRHVNRNKRNAAHHGRHRRRHGHQSQHTYTHAPASSMTLEYERVYGVDPSSPMAFAALPLQPDVVPRATGSAWTPLVRALFCPRPKCPYLLTKRNRQFCARMGKSHYAPVEVSALAVREHSRWEARDTPVAWSFQPTLFTLLVLSVALYGALTLYVFCM